MFLQDSMRLQSSFGWLLLLLRLILTLDSLCVAGLSGLVFPPCAMCFPLGVMSLVSISRITEEADQDSASGVPGWHSG